jgi:hypothetical protein
MKNISLILISISLSIFSLLANASANKPKPGQKSTYCYFNLGPKLGQTENLIDKAKPVLLGRTCADDEGNSGISVLDKEEAEAEEAADIAKDALKAGKIQYSSKVKLATICLYNEGPRAGESEDFKDRNPPIPVGTPCSDGIHNIGVTISE